MWHVVSLTMMRSAGLSCCGKEARMFIHSEAVVTLLSCRSKMSGYAAKESVLCSLLHISAKVETWGGGQGLLDRMATAKVGSFMGSWGGGDLVWIASVIGTCPVPTFPHLIASSSSGAEGGIGGLAVCMQEETTPTRQPPIPTSAPEEEEAIRWEQVGTEQVSITEAPHTRPPPSHEPINKRILAVANPPSNPRPLSPASMFAEVCSKQQRTNSLAAYSAIFDLQDNNVTTTSERMNILASLKQQERPALLIIVKEATRHIRVLWGIDKLPFSYENRTSLDGRIVAFSCDIIAGNTPPTIAIDEEWWNHEDRPVPTEQEAESEVSKLRTGDTNISEATTGAKTTRLTQAYVTPFALAHPLLTAPYLSPAVYKSNLYTSSMIICCIDRYWVQFISVDPLSSRLVESNHLPKLIFGT